MLLCFCRADVWGNLSNIWCQVKSSGAERCLQQITSSLFARAWAKCDCKSSEAVLPWSSWTGADHKTYAKVWAGIQYVAITIMLYLLMDIMLQHGFDFLRIFVKYSSVVLFFKICLALSLVELFDWDPVRDLTSKYLVMSEYKLLFSINVFPWFLFYFDIL